MRPQEYLAVARSAFDAHGVHVTRAIDGSGHSLSVTKTAAGRRYIEISPDTLDMVRHYSDQFAEFMREYVEEHKTSDIVKKTEHAAPKLTGTGNRRK